MYHSRDETDTLLSITLTEEQHVIRCKQFYNFEVPLASVLNLVYHHRMYVFIQN